MKFPTVVIDADIVTVEIPCRRRDGNLERTARGSWQHTDADRRRVCDVVTPDEDQLRDEMHDELRDLARIPLADVAALAAAWARVDAYAAALAEIDGRTPAEVIAGVI